MNWIVTWVIFTMFVVSCPDKPSESDEFGVTQPSFMVSTMACYDTEKKSMSREFATREEAEAFIERGKKAYPNSPSRMNESWATDWKLLEVKCK